VPGHCIGANPSHVSRRSVSRASDKTVALHD
jgi:hypothetical protein